MITVDVAPEADAGPFQLMGSHSWACVEVMRQAVRDAASVSASGIVWFREYVSVVGIFDPGGDCRGAVLRMGEIYLHASGVCVAAQDAARDGIGECEFHAIKEEDWERMLGMCSRDQMRNAKKYIRDRMKFRMKDGGLPVG